MSLEPPAIPPKPPDSDGPAPRWAPEPEGASSLEPSPALEDGAAPGQAPAPMAPMDLGQVVDAVIVIYRRRWALLLGLCAVLQVPAAILAGLILLPLRARIEEIVGFDLFDPPTTIDVTAVRPPPTDEQILGIMGPIWLSALVTIVAGTLTTVAVAHAVHGLRLGRAASIGGTVRAVFVRLGPVLLALVAYTAALVGLVVLAFVALVTPFSLAPSAVGGGPLAFAAVLAFAALLVLTVFVSIRWTFWPQAVIVDATGAVASLGRSWRLVAGSTWRVLGYALLFGLAASILQGILAQLGLIVVDALRDLLPDALHLVLTFAVSTLAALLLAPVVPVALTLLYLDVRIRRGERLE